MPSPWHLCSDPHPSENNPEELNSKAEWKALFSGNLEHLWAIPLPFEQALPVLRLCQWLAQCGGGNRVEGLCLEDQEQQHAHWICLEACAVGPSPFLICTPTAPTIQRGLFLLEGTRRIKQDVAWALWSPWCHLGEDLSFLQNEKQPHGFQSPFGLPQV